MQWTAYLLWGTVESTFASELSTVLNISEYSVMWELDHREGSALENCCFQTVVLETTLERPLDSKESKPVHPKENQAWIFFGRTDAEAEAPILWPPVVKRRLIGKDFDAGKGWPVQGTQIQSLVWKDSTHSETTKAHTKQRIPSTAKNE